jgi:hypothetical protein
VKRKKEKNGISRRIKGIPEKGYQKKAPWSEGKAYPQL